ILSKIPQDQDSEIRGGLESLKNSIISMRPVDQGYQKTDLVEMTKAFQREYKKITVRSTINMADGKAVVSSYPSPLSRVFVNMINHETTFRITLPKADQAMLNGVGQEDTKRVSASIPANCYAHPKDKEDFLTMLPSLEDAAKNPDQYYTIISAGKTRSLQPKS